MKTKLRLFFALCTVGFCFHHAQAAPASTNETGFRLTIELRDGSRIVGKSLDNALRFHSSVLGDLKLPLENIRSIDGVTTNLAKLTTANGDVLTGWFIASVLRAETSFGKTELPVKLIRSVRISSMNKVGQLPSGLLALWSGEGDGNDAVGGNNATLTDISFAEGKVGQAFSFNGTSAYFKIPDHQTLDVGAGEGFTVSAWIKPSRVSGIYNVIEWNDYLCAFEIGQNPSDQGVLLASIFDSDRNIHFLRSGAGTIVANVFQHIALTYDKASG
ncbi:MAG TPA: LamG-like jellyroll fold domain-containing protein, partial [Sedimentisphaerales bacterium]